MKKFRIIFVTVMLGIATVGGFQAYEYANMSTADALLLENVDALTYLEHWGDHNVCPNGCLAEYDADGCWCYGYEPNVKEKVW